MKMKRERGGHGRRETPRRLTAASHVAIFAEPHVFGSIAATVEIRLLHPSNLIARSQTVKLRFAQFSKRFLDRVALECKSFLESKPFEVSQQSHDSVVPSSPTISNHEKGDQETTRADCEPLP